MICRRALVFFIFLSQSKPEEHTNFTSRKETKMRDLTPEEEKHLVKYCLESKDNTWLALAIGQIQPALEMEILDRFLEDLDKSIRDKLKEDSQWKTKKMVNRGKWGKWETIYKMTMKDPVIEINIDYDYEGNKELCVGTPENNEVCPGKEEIERYFEGAEDLEAGDGNVWWCYPEEVHNRLDLRKQYDPEETRNHIGYFRDLMVNSSDAVSKALRAGK